MSEEREILSEERVAVGLVLKGHLKKELLGLFKRSFAFVKGGPIEGVTFGASMDEQKRRALSHTLLQMRDVVEGDPSDVMTYQKYGRLILTNKRIVFHYQVGFRTKTDRVLAFSLQHAKSVEEKKKLLGGYLQISFEIPTDEKPINFDLHMWVKNRSQWLAELTDVIQ